MRMVIEFVFPRYLARLSFFLRDLLCHGVMLYLYQDPWGETPAGIATMIAMLLYTSLFVLLPRIRDIGMGAWWMVLAFIPYVSAFLGAALLFRRTDPRHNPLVQRAPGAPPPLPVRPEAAAGPERA